MATPRDWAWLAIAQTKEGRVTVEQIQNKAAELSYQGKPPSRDTVRSVLLFLTANKKCAHEDGSKYYHLRV